MHCGVVGASTCTYSENKAMNQTGYSNGWMFTLHVLWLCVSKTATTFTLYRYMVCVYTQTISISYRLYDTLTEIWVYLVAWLLYIADLKLCSHTTEEVCACTASTLTIGKG